MTAGENWPDSGSGRLAPCLDPPVNSRISGANGEGTIDDEGKLDHWCSVVHCTLKGVVQGARCVVLARCYVFVKVYKVLYV